MKSLLPMMMILSLVLMAINPSEVQATVCNGTNGCSTQLLTALVPAIHSVSQMDVMLLQFVHSLPTVLIHLLESNVLVLNCKHDAD